MTFFNAGSVRLLFELRSNPAFDTRTVHEEHALDHRSAAGVGAGQDFFFGHDELISISLNLHVRLTEKVWIF